MVSVMICRRRRRDEENGETDGRRVTRRECRGEIRGDVKERLRQECGVLTDVHRVTERERDVELSTLACASHAR